MEKRVTCDVCHKNIKNEGESLGDGGWTTNALDTRNFVDVVKKTVGDAGVLALHFL